MIALRSLTSCSIVVIFFVLEKLFAARMNSGSHFSICQKRKWNSINVTETYFGFNKLTCALLCTRRSQCDAATYKEEGEECVLFGGCPKSIISCDSLQLDEDTESMYKTHLQHVCPCNYAYDADTNTCYRISLERKTAYAAESQCQIEGGHLLRVVDINVWGMIRTAVQNPPYDTEGDFFVDGTEEGHPGQWTYTDGTTSTWLIWGLGEPSHAHEQCIALYDHKGYRFNDVGCTASLPFVCQID